MYRQGAEFIRHLVQVGIVYGSVMKDEKQFSSAILLLKVNNTPYPVFLCWRNRPLVRRC